MLTEKQMLFRYVIVLLIAVLILGCSDGSISTGISNQRNFNSSTILDVRWMRLPEGTYHFTDLVSLSGDRTGYIELSLTLETWPEHYGLEYFVLEESEFAKLQDNQTFRANTHKTITTKGTYADSTEIDYNRDYRIIIDNSDSGWEKTDTDSIEDNPVFHITVRLWE